MFPAQMPSLRCAAHALANYMCARSVLRSKSLLADEHCSKGVLLCFFCMRHAFGGNNGRHKRGVQRGPEAADDYDLQSVIAKWNDRAVIQGVLRAMVSIVHKSHARTNRSYILIVFPSGTLG